MSKDGEATVTERSNPKSKLIVISAPSGTGKTTLCARLLREIPELMLSISTTTRSPRGAERHGVEYFFVTREDFQRTIDSDGFAEWAEVHGNRYGTTKAFIDESMSQGKSLLLDIDVQGAESLKRAYPDRVLRIFLVPPSLEELERRLRGRGTDSEESIQKRMKAAEKEMQHAREFDHVVVNDDLERAYFETAGIILHSIRGTVVAR